MSILHDIGIKYQTDKAWGHKYMDFYDTFFSPIRYDVKKVIEIGVYFGASIQTWLEYFPNATIYGIDCGYRPEVPLHDRFVYITKNALLEEVYSSFVDNDIDIVIDDGSHLMSEQQEALKLYWSKVKSGGYFVMEDLHTSFCNDGTGRYQFLDRVPTTYDFLIHNFDSKDIELNAVRNSFNEKKHLFNRDETFTISSSITCLIQK